LLSRKKNRRKSADDSWEEVRVRGRQKSQREGKRADVGEPNAASAGKDLCYSEDGKKHTPEILIQEGVGLEQDEAKDGNERHTLIRREVESGRREPQTRIKQFGKRKLPDGESV